MTARALAGLLALILPVLAHGVETKIGSNLSGSMPKVTLTNATIFPQETTLTVFGTPTETFILDAHSSTEVFVECHASEQNSRQPFGVRTSAETWTQQIPSAQIVSSQTALWISSQRQGRAHIEALIRSEVPNLKLLHLSLSESPKSLAELDQIALILISAGDLERLSNKAFEMLRGAIGLGVPLIISAREKSDHNLPNQATLTSLRFGAWQPVPSELGTALPAATRVAGVLDDDSESGLTLDGVKVVAESPYGFGWVRLLAVPFATMRDGAVTSTVFGYPKSRMAHPTRWLESQTSPPVQTFFLSWMVPISGILLFLIVLIVRRSRILVPILVLVWWGIMISEPVADQSVLMSMQWGIETPVEAGGVVLARMDVDHRLGGAIVLDSTQRQLDLKMLRTGAVCLIHRDSKTRLLFPQTLDRMTRIFVGYTHASTAVKAISEATLSLPEWPRDEFAGSSLNPIRPLDVSDGCEQGRCDFYRIGAEPVTAQ